MLDLAEFALRLLSAQVDERLHREVRRLAEFDHLTFRLLDIPDRFGESFCDVKRDVDNAVLITVQEVTGVNG